MYLDTAGYGLPPRRTVAALAQCLETWREGTAEWERDWDMAGDRCRLLAGGVLGCDTDDVALLPAVSVGVGIALGSVRRGSEVLLPEDEFASVVLPVLAAARLRDLRIRRVPFAELANEVSPATGLAATSHVRSNDGRVQDLASLAEACRGVGAKVLVDATHAAGILPIPSAALGLDFVLAAAYKHLLCPRGVALMRIAPAWWSATPSIVASWRSTADVYARYYGPGLDDLAPAAARFDVSLAWHAWVGAEQSFGFLDEVDAAERAEWCVGLASRLADRLGIPPTGSSIVSVPVHEAARVRARLQAARIRVSGKGSRVRVSFHLYNTEAEMHAVAELLAPFVCARAGACP
jgi:selenocysteine lyase/cysteine desulfurase